jgi:hypothetical protein
MWLSNQVCGSWVMRTVSTLEELYRKTETI